MTRYFIEPRTRMFVKEYGFSSFTRNLSDKYGEKKSLKTATIKVVFTTVQSTGELIGNKIAKNYEAKVCG